MNNQLDINGHKAIVSFDSDICLFRGEFIGLNGGADFYADSVDALMREGAQSLHLFLSICHEKGVEPYQQFSGNLIAKITPILHEKILITAASAGQSFNEWIASVLEREVSHAI
jgi:predicted HicB family RNase H-like nuclease